MTDTARQQRIAASLEALADTPGQHERVAIQWNGAQRTMDVVQIPLDAVVLNPNSHRIKAELESSADHEQIVADPFSQESQAKISALLRSTPDYEVLKSDLKENGQQDFGVATRAGLLVNANTRAVALRDLGVEYIKVAVLPSDADNPAIEELEAYLQLRVERKQPYSFPNELLFIFDMKNRGKSDEDLALQLGYAPSQDPGDLRRGKERIKQAIRMLALMREVCATSGGAITLKFFENHRQSLQEIDSAYESEKARDQAAASRVRDARVLGLLAGLGYRELRNVDTQLLSSYIRTGIQEDATLEGLDPVEDEGPGSAETQDDDLSLFEDEVTDEGGAALDLTPVMESLLRTHGTNKVQLPGAATEASRDEVLDSLRRVYQDAIDDKRSDDSLTDRLQAPVTLLDEATRKVNKAKDVVADVHARPGFPKAEVVTKIAALRRSIDALEQQLP